MFAFALVAAELATHEDMGGVTQVKSTWRKPAYVS